MPSQIKILRKFLSFVDDRPTIFFNVGNRRSYIGHYEINDYSFTNDFGIENNDNHPCPFLFLVNKNSLQIDLNRSMLIDPDDFKDYDDTSLVLTYGRSILDENIIQEWNDIQISKSNPLSLSDFDDFFKIGE